MRIWSSFEMEKILFYKIFRFSVIQILYHSRKKNYPFADNLLAKNENSVVELQNHELNEQLMIISQLDEDENNASVKIINSMLTKKRMKNLLNV